MPPPKPRLGDRVRWWLAERARRRVMRTLKAYDLRPEIRPGDWSGGGSPPQNQTRALVQVNFYPRPR